MRELLRGYAGFFFPHRIAVLPRAAWGVADRALLNRPHLRVAEIAVTFTCNSKCVMCSCFNFCDPEKEKQRLTPAEYASLGRQLDRQGCVSVNLTGGEPLMRPDIGDIITALNPKNKIANLITNGILLTAESLERFKRIGVDSVVVSLESTSAEENDRIRGHAGHFETVMNIIRWARALRMRLGLSLTLGDFNFDKVHELLRFARAHGAFLCIAHGGSIGRWQDNAGVHLSESNARAVLAMARRTGEMKIDFSANLSLCPGCPGIVEKIFITPYGDVLPCTFNPISFGNLREEPLSSIWKKMISFHHDHVHGGTLCMREYDEKYRSEFLDPIRGMKLPVRIENHPALKKNGR